MAGIVKRKYISETIKYKKTFSRPLNLISEVLPIDYTKNTILELFKQLYPMEWDILNQRYEIYKKKDAHLIRIGKKKRYYHDTPELFFFKLTKLKHLVSTGHKNKHRAGFDLEKISSSLEKLKNNRKFKIKNYYDKISNAKKLIQNIEPLYIDIFIAAYHDRRVTTKDKIEILNEIKKYSCGKSIDFLQKINDSERNTQVRLMAFEHLQKIGSFVKLRKNFKGKKKSYATEIDPFEVTPKDLVEKIEKNTIQNKKSFDIFISHSYKDSDLVTKLKDILNAHDISVYCDWSNDNDFLKRSSISEYTEIVLKKRIEQSNTFLFLQTDNSVKNNTEILSKWVQMEINYATEKLKPIYCLNITDGDDIFKPIFFEKKDGLIFISENEVKKLTHKIPLKN